MAYKRQFGPSNGPTQTPSSTSEKGKRKQKRNRNRKPNQAARRNTQSEVRQMVSESFGSLERVALAQISASTEILKASVGVAQTLADKVSEEDAANVFGDLLGFLSQTQSRALESEEKLTELILDRVESVVKQIAPVVMIRQQARKLALEKEIKGYESKISDLESSIEGLKVVLKSLNESNDELNTLHSNTLKEYHREVSELTKRIAELEAELYNSKPEEYDDESAWTEAQG